MRYLIISATLASLALPVAAQQPPMRPSPRPDMAARRQREGDDLALVLGLAAAQRPALDAFLAAERPPMPPRSEQPDGPGATPPTFDQQLARREAMAGEHQAHERAQLAAARTFYAQLDPRQKRVFGALMRLRHGPGLGGHGGPGGPREGDGPPPRD